MFIFNNKLPTVIYKLGVIYNTTIAPINKDQQPRSTTHILTWASESFVLHVPPPVKDTSPSRHVKFGTSLNHVNPDVLGFWILVRTFGTHRGATVKHTTWPLVNLLTSCLRRETTLTDSHPRLAAMTDTNTLQQFQNHIPEIEWCHKEELTKLKANHDQLEVHVRHHHGDEQSTHTLPKCTQGESHPRRTGNTFDNLSLAHMHRPATQTVRRHPFIDRIMEADTPLGGNHSTSTGTIGQQIQTSIWMSS